MSRILMSLFACTLLFAACTKKTSENTATAPKEEQVVNLSIWGNYLSPEMQAKFEKETGLKLNISNYSSSEELLAKVQMGSSGIDVAVPSDYMVDIMIKMNLLEPLKAELIPNKALLSPQFLAQSYDKENKFSLPYTWTTMGIAVNRSLYKGSLKSWKELYNNSDLKGKFALLDDVRETIGSAMIANGASVNSTNPAELAKAKATLLGAKKNVKMFTSDTVDILKNKEVVAAQAYSSDALQAAMQNKDIEYFIPEEGGTIAIDNLVIIRGSKHPEAAHKLVNFLISQEADLNKVQVIRGGPVLKGTQEKLPQDLQANKSLFPEAKVMKKLEAIHDLGDKNKLWEELWTEIKTH
ncbi:polyamine ABC transporter substrate-binding protein [Bdellovibrio svalbardensis]|uniref:Spermidine/putrescine ABC transporter substrate-binding protein n=1 Tax=Bdellovibrio svalbardensis TaxID=2972972 RepID=A0ABT6DL47_9BACT|nr:spermidine/putrescine ABC transporter substrate-binding protein [Bdellovibrio svalbardensis]MDG0817601.1 spermidine/putrescine ABC transporter substrate-binding protein [Bdellovibrio svalbardensis]